MCVSAGGSAGGGAICQQLSATQVKANKMRWTKLHFSINGIIPWLMCRPVEHNTRSTQGQSRGRPFGCCPATWEHHHLHHHYWTGRIHSVSVNNIIKYNEIIELIFWANSSLLFLFLTRCPRGIHCFFSVFDCAKCLKMALDMIKRFTNRSSLID